MTHHPNTPASRNEEVAAVLQSILADACDSESETNVPAELYRRGVEALAASRTEQAAPSVASWVEKEDAGKALQHVYMTLAEVPCKCSARRREEGVHFTGCHLFDLCVAIDALADILALAAPGAAIAAREQPTDVQLAAMVKAAGGDVTEDGATATVEHGDFSFHLDADALRKLLASRQEAPAIAAREQESKAQAAINAIAALEPVELKDFPYAGRFRCQQCRFEWGGDLGTEGHATNCAYVIATSVPHTPSASRQEAPAASAEEWMPVTPEQHSKAFAAGDLMALAEEAGGARMAENVVQVTRSDIERIIYFAKDREDTAARSPATVAQPVVMKYSSQRTHHRSGAPMPDVVYEAAPTGAAASTDKGDGGSKE